MGRVICTRPTGWILELDITAYFDSIVREQLIELIEKRVSDRSVLRLIRKWIQVGVIDQGQFLVTETGTGHGQTISPLLANIYLHHVLDEWFEDVVKPRLRGEAHEIRFADDAILCFHYREDVLSERFAKYGLTLHPEKTRLLEFGRYAEERAKRQGKKKPNHLRLSWLYAHLRPQPEREVHSARADDAQAAPQEPHGGRRVVSEAPTCPCG
jgi:retron-type reverse transcriptase